MDDLISKGDAIKAIEGLPNCPNGYSDTYDKAYIIGAIEEVPSANQWIPCSERLPSEDGDYLVFDGGIWIVWFSIVNGWDSDQVLAWQPLPQPFKGDE